MTGTLTPIVPYNGATNCGTTTQTAGTNSTGGTGTAVFAFDTAAAASTYGDDLATVGGSAGVGLVAFVTNISTSQPSGTYSSTFTFIAVPTY